MLSTLVAGAHRAATAVCHWCYDGHEGIVTSPSGNTKPRKQDQGRPGMLKQLTATVALVLGGTPAWADSRSDCVQAKNLDTSISGCTAIISQTPNAAWAYNNRGSAYRRKGDYDRAIADYTKAIEI